MNDIEEWQTTTVEVCPNDVRIEIEDYLSSIDHTLSHDQKEALIDITVSFCKGCKTHTLTGNAGMGKSFTLKYIVDVIKNVLGWKFELTAMTHKAANVVEEGSGIPCRTLHSAVGIKPKKVKGGFVSVLTGNNKILGDHGINQDVLLCVDEASMLDDQLRAEVEKEFSGTKVRILYIGDDKQLPPVNGKSTIFDSTSLSRLTTVHRQAMGNPIIAQANTFREWMDNPTTPFPRVFHDPLDSITGVFVLPHDEIKPFVKSWFASLPREVASIDHRIGCFNNTAVRNYNKMLRSVMYDSEEFVEDEWLYANDTVERNGEIVLMNNTRVVVDKVEPDKLNGVDGRKVWSTEGRGFFVPYDWNHVDIYLNDIKQACINGTARWPDYYEARSAFVDLREPFASTIHKMQGSTYHTVMLDMRDIYRCREPFTLARLVYTALTRASNAVVCFL